MCYCVNLKYLLSDSNLIKIDIVVAEIFGDKHLHTYPQTFAFKEKTF